MIHHLVLWKFDDMYSSEEKIEIKKQLKERLLNLTKYIKELKFIAVSFNSGKASAENFDIVLNTRFENFEDLHKYQINPEHLKVAEYLKTLKLKRASVDYED